MTISEFTITETTTTKTNIITNTETRFSNLLRLTSWWRLGRRQQIIPGAWKLWANFCSWEDLRESIKEDGTRNFRFGSGLKWHSWRCFRVFITKHLKVWSLYQVRPCQLLYMNVSSEYEEGMNEGRTITWNLIENQNLNFNHFTLFI